MNTPDLSPLIKGIMVIVGIAIGLGQYGRLERWARNQAMEAVAWKEPLPYFFAVPRGVRLHRHVVTHAVVPRRQSDRSRE